MAEGHDFRRGQAGVVQHLELGKESDVAERLEKHPVAVTGAVGMQPETDVPPLVLDQCLLRAHVPEGQAEIRQRDEHVQPGQRGRQLARPMVTPAECG
ncbi:MAG: hypothetical protein EXS42_07935 [Lacunisphaera sp.]|nr:hypothetical protein [Lacunisphaera sp.]